MSMCISTECDRYYECQKAYNRDSYDAVDFMNQGSGGSDAETTYMCGPKGNYALYEKTSTDVGIFLGVANLPINRDIIIAEMPSHTCKICGEVEYPPSSIESTEFWICPNCLSKLKNIILKGEESHG